MRDVVYLAHPVGAEDAAGVAANVERARRWLAFVRRHEPDTTVIAPWIAAISAGENDRDPVQRERGLLDAEAVCGRVDGIVLCGGRISTGMKRELDAVILACGWVADLTSLGEEPPAELPTTRGWDGEVETISPLDLGRSCWEAP